VNEKYYYIIIAVVSVGLFLTLAKCFHWSNPIWSKINKKIKIFWNVPIFLLSVVVINIVTQLVLEVFTISPAIIKLILCIEVGPLFLLMPFESLNINNKDKKD
jgi:hypothetical protein